VRRLSLLAALIAPKAAFAGAFEDAATGLRVVLHPTDNICVVVPNELRDERGCEGIDVSQVERGIQQASGTRHLLFGFVRNGNDIFMLTLIPDDVYGHGAEMNKTVATEILRIDRQNSATRPAKEAFALDPEERRLPNGIQVWIDDYPGWSKQFDQMFRRTYILVGGRGGASLSVTGSRHRDEDIRAFGDRFVRTIRMPPPHRFDVRHLRAIAMPFAAGATIVVGASIAIWSVVRSKRRQRPS
jgi:hypothetical protein